MQQQATGFCSVAILGCDAQNGGLAVVEGHVFPRMSMSVRTPLFTQDYVETVRIQYFRHGLGRMIMKSRNLYMADEAG